ncbi:uncharacterized protein BDZ99DRAFT_471929 [Mytilinidion resinicola]|uniref:Uncharacterized protein n=1 Tax=Mytilinidion resinicola TaxID=574789 RepID=A0A6A6Z0G4_9PEZI|nr:uncharacterized protein BDZ99DRAFT_471929 [Mytilinidion resinicola]KAF2814510.1 hypothetical protein BDZ99DRAFT_471929 [Mytilinidion resinicola]
MHKMDKKSGELCTAAQGPILQFKSARGLYIATNFKSLKRLPPMSDKYKRLFSSASILLGRRRLGIDIIEANKCLQLSYGPPPTDAFNNAEHAALLGASRVSPASLAEQVEERLRASQREEANAMAADGDDEALAEQELREAEEEAILEGPAPPTEVVDVDEDNMVLSDGSGSQFR